MKKKRLFAPGPVEVAPAVLTAMAVPLVHHRSEEFRAVFARAQSKLQQLMLLDNDDVLILSASGTAAFESGLLATIPKGAKVLGINAGKFGERWVELARKYGYEVIEYKIEWGRTVDFKVLEELLIKHNDLKAIMTTHSETSTGVLHDVQAISELCHKLSPQALVLVDAVSSLGAAELRPKDWGLDGVFAGSQKGLMLPPGLAFAWLSDRAWNSDNDLNQTFYLDLRKERSFQQKHTTAYTSSVSLIFALDASLDLILLNGLENLWQEKMLFTQAILKAAEAIGCTRFAERVSPATAALVAPEAIAAEKIVAGFAKRGMHIAGGQGFSKSFLFRPAVLGFNDSYDVISIVAALEDVLRELGKEIPYGQGVAVAMEMLEKAGI